MTVTINGTTGIANDGGYTGDGVVFADTTPANTLVTTTGGNVGIGTNLPAAKLNVVTSGGKSTVAIGDQAASTYSQVLMYGGSGKYNWSIGAQYNLDNAFEITRSTATGGTTFSSPSLVIDSSGNLLVGTTTNGNSAKFLVVAGSTGGTSLQAGFGGINGTSFQIYHADAGGQSSAATVTSIAKVASTNRSINAAGTINASGADYAEYMTKAGEFIVAKGDVVGIDSNGKLTNVFSDAVSFCVKSTAPSYVGGDTWGAELEGDELEAARQAVDRIAFAGQVPVNVLGATPGQFIIPVDSNGAIIGQAVSNPTFEQYQIAVGKVIAIESDGRARIIVKVA